MDAKVPYGVRAAISICISFVSSNKYVYCGELVDGHGRMMRGWRKIKLQALWMLREEINGGWCWACMCGWLDVVATETRWWNRSLKTGKNIKCSPTPFWIYSHTRTYMHTCIQRCTNTHIYVHTYMHTAMHNHKHIYIHTTHKRYLHNMLEVLNC